MIAAGAPAVDAGGTGAAVVDTVTVAVVVVVVGVAAAAATTTTCLHPTQASTNGTSGSLF
jgi:hypothetical protein